MAVLTISRELGSEGDNIAERVCEELGYRRVDKDVLLEIAEEAGIDVDAVRKMEQSFTTRARLVSDEMTSLYRKQASAFEHQGAIDDKTYADVLQESIEAYARQGNVVIVGRGGQMILQTWSDAIHVRLFAPEEARVRRLMAREGWDEREATRRVQRSDEQKRQYIRHMHHNADWRNMKYYHLAIDTSQIPPETATQMIVLAAHAKDQT